jgi:phosphatidylethanolamine/phosphatidyl-N-methylethanolamine N-methyltransferase
VAAALDRDRIEKAYDRWAPVYDKVFGKVFAQGRTASIAAAEAHVGPGGGRILDVGIGTGISLLAYRRINRIVGIDISAGMLRRAQDRVEEHGLDNVDVLSVMDAKHLALPDATFDAVVAQYVITAVPDPEATLDEFVRVLRPGGEIILVNHLGAESGFRWLFEQGFSPIARQLGWSPEFPWARLTGWADRTPGVSLIERRPMPPMGHFSLIRFGKAG